ncbi:MAG: S8 family serine peptidase [Deltaproteobacteria bacterium]|nr:S8 family serine peptidase [Deltaproteobacteria bacterium]
MSPLNRWTRGVLLCFAVSLYAAATLATEGVEVAHDASSVVVAVIDTGAELDHPDLEPNLWKNASEIPGDGIDNDGNGYIDDIHGYDFFHGASDPVDEWGHGTLVSGIIGAVGENEIGFKGIAWSVQLMVLKVFGEKGTEGVSSQFIEAVDYAISNGARIINTSWSVSPSDGGQVPLLKKAFERAREAGILVVAAAGNEATDLDDSPVYPAAYSFDNLISVAALNKAEEGLLEISNFGKEKVTVATLGEKIPSTSLDDGYATLTGTSASAAIVSGVGALLISINPDLTSSEIREILIESSDPLDSLDQVISGGGKINASAALTVAREKAKTGDSQTEGGGAAISFSGGGCALIRESSRETCDLMSQGKRRDGPTIFKTSLGTTRGFEITL